MKRRLTWTTHLAIAIVALLAAVSIFVVSMFHKNSTTAGLDKRDRIILLGSMANDAGWAVRRTGPLADEELIAVLNEVLRRQGRSLQVYRSKPSVSSGLMVAIIREQDCYVLYFINAIEENGYKISSNESTGIGVSHVNAVLAAREDVKLLWIGRSDGGQAD